MTEMCNAYSSLSNGLQHTLTRLKNHNTIKRHQGRHQKEKKKPDIPGQGLSAHDLDMSGLPAHVDLPFFEVLTLKQ